MSTETIHFSSSNYPLLPAYKCMHLKWLQIKNTAMKAQLDVPG